MVQKFPPYNTNNNNNKIFNNKLKISQPHISAQPIDGLLVDRRLQVRVADAGSTGRAESARRGGAEACRFGGRASAPAQAGDPHQGPELLPITLATLQRLQACFSMSFWTLLCLESPQFYRATSADLPSSSRCANCPRPARPPRPRPPPPPRHLECRPKNGPCPNGRRPPPTWTCSTPSWARRPPCSRSATRRSRRRRPTCSDWKWKNGGSAVRALSSWAQWRSGRAQAPVSWE